MNSLIAVLGPSCFYFYRGKGAVVNIMQNIDAIEQQGGYALRWASGVTFAKIIDISQVE